jgi:RND family efflux transporter MFP subunit
MDSLPSPHAAPHDPARPPSGDPPATGRRRTLPIGLGAGALVIILVVVALVRRAESQINKVALAASPKPATAVAARAATYRPTHVYVGTLRPWVEANVGPQFVSAYVDTVLVRPGAVVKKNEVLATLDCRNTSASSLAVAAEARAVDARQKAIADESARLHGLLDGGFVSTNEAEQKEAQSASEQAQLAAERAKLMSTGLAVNDCVLRAPFDGEVAVRSIDPGAFVRPGVSMVTLIDRSTVRVTFEVPESDFGAVGPASPASIAVLATGRTIAGTIARRAPAADPDTRTVHVEVDLENRDESIPVNTTGQVTIPVGQPRPASAIPLAAASVTGSSASIFVVDRDLARRRRLDVLGEEGATLYVDPALQPGTAVITEGRALLNDGDPVAAKEATESGALSSGSGASDGAKPAREVAP